MGAALFCCQVQRNGSPQANSTPTRVRSGTLVHFRRPSDEGPQIFGPGITDYAIGFAWSRATRYRRTRVSKIDQARISE